MHLVLEALEQRGVAIYSLLENYLATWRGPSKFSGEHLGTLCSAKHRDTNRKSKSFKCTASDGLSVLPILAHYFKTLLRAGQCVHELSALIALDDLVDELKAVPRGDVAPDAVRQKVKVFLEHCIRAEWRMHMHSKFHWLVHLPTQLAHHGMLPTCWVHERKH